MIVTPLPIVPAPDAAEPGAHADVPLGSASSGPSAAGAFADAVAGALDGTRARLERASETERAFVSGRGSLQAMVLERAQADVALTLAAAAASRVTQSLSTILGMQV